MYISPNSLKNSPTDLQPGEWQLFCECGFKFEKGTAAKPICPDCRSQMYIASEGETIMDEVFIKALVNQALGAYKASGPDGLKQWINNLPLPHQEEFRQHCAKPLEAAMMAQLGESIGELLAEFQPSEPTENRILTDYESSEKALKKLDPRKKHTRDQRRTKPL